MPFLTLEHVEWIYNERKGKELGQGVNFKHYNLPSDPPGRKKRRIDDLPNYVVDDTDTEFFKVFKKIEEVAELVPVLAKGEPKTYKAVYKEGRKVKTSQGKTTIDKKHHINPALKKKFVGFVGTMTRNINFACADLDNQPGVFELIAALDCPDKNLPAAFSHCNRVELDDKLYGIDDQLRSKWIPQLEALGDQVATLQGELAIHRTKTEGLASKVESNTQAIKELQVHRNKTEGLASKVESNTQDIKDLKDKGTKVEELEKQIDDDRNENKANFANMQKRIDALYALRCPQWAPPSLDNVDDDDDADVDASEQEQSKQAACNDAPEFAAAEASEQAIDSPWDDTEDNLVVADDSSYDDEEVAVNTVVDGNTAVSSSTATEDNSFVAEIQESFVAIDTVATSNIAAEDNSAAQETQRSFADKRFLAKNTTKHGATMPPEQQGASVMATADNLASTDEKTIAESTYMYYTQEKLQKTCLRRLFDKVTLLESFDLPGQVKCVLVKHLNPSYKGKVKQGDILCHGYPAIGEPNWRYKDLAIEKLRRFAVSNKATFGESIVRLFNPTTRRINVRPPYDFTELLCRRDQRSFRGPQLEILLSQPVAPTPHAAPLRRSVSISGLSKECLFNELSPASNTKYRGETEVPTKVSDNYRVLNKE